MTIKRQHKDPCNDDHAFYLHCINVNILFVILYQTFLRCYTWGTLGKICMGFSVLLLTVLCKFYDYFKIQHLT
jgi:hypothetical protein